MGGFEGYEVGLEPLLEAVRRYGIRLVLASNLDAASVPGRSRDLDEEAANEAMAGAARRHFDRLRALFWARPGDGSPDRARDFLGRPGPDGEGTPLFAGIKLHPEMNDFPADASAVDGYLEAARDGGVPVVVHSDEKDDRAHPRRILALARRHPSVPVVLYHMGFEGPHDAAIEAARAAREAGDARLFLETSQAAPEAVLRAIRAVGSGRVLFGTDATYYGRDHYASYRGLLEALDGALDAADRDRILRENARRIFPLPGSREGAR